MSHPWMPLYVGDYLSKTQRLGAAEHGAYLLLIMEYWQSGGLPDDDAQLARICRMTEREWKKTRPVIEPFFGDGWQHDRVDEELAKADAKHQRRADAGRKGGKAKASAKPAESKPHSIATQEKAGNALASSSHSPSHPPAAQHTGTPREMEPEPEPPSKGVGQTDAPDLAIPWSLDRTPGKLDRLEAEMREAAGLADDPSPGLLDLSPMVELLDKGWSLAKDILPKLREAKAKGKRGSTWRYYLPAITEAKAANGSIPAKPQAQPAKVATTWITDQDPRWPELAKAHGLTAKGSRHEHGLGAFVPNDWLTEAA